MADPALLTEAYKRGLLPPDQAAAFEEAQRRGLVSDHNDQGVVAQYLGGAADAIKQAADPLMRMMGIPATDATRNVASLMATGKPMPAVSAPTTVPGQYARTLGNFSLAAAAPGTAPQRVFGAVVPALTSEAAGQATKGSILEIPARIFGGLLGGLGANAAAAKTDAMMAPKPILPTTQPDVTQAAARKAATYIQSLADGKTPDQIGAVPAPMTAGEALGKPGEVALGALARRPGQTGDLLSGVITQRQTERPTRMLGAVQNATGVAPAAAQGDIEAMVRAGRHAAAPLYEEAYAGGPIASDALNALMKRPSMDKALNRAISIAAEEGRNPKDLGLVTTTSRENNRPGSSDIGKVTRQRLDYTWSPQTWDYVKRGLDDIIEGYRDPVTRKLNLDELGRAQLSTLTDLRNELRAQSPAYARALDASGDYLSLNQAYQDGGKMLTNGMLTERQFGERIANMTPGQRDAFKAGIANSYYNMAQNGRLDPKVLKTPRVQTKLNLALGPDAAKLLVDQAETEAGMKLFERRAPGINSPTAEYGAEMHRQDQINGGPGLGADLAGRMLQGESPKEALVGAALKKAQDLIAARHTLGMPQAARDEAGRILAGPPEALADTLRAYAAQTVPEMATPGYGLPAMLRPAQLGRSVVGLTPAAKSQSDR